MDVWIVYQGYYIRWKNESQYVIAVYKHEKDARDRVETEERIKDESRIYFYCENIELFEGRDIVRDKEVAIPRWL